jgi:hypothetical protein
MPTAGISIMNCQESLRPTQGDQILIPNAGRTLVSTNVVSKHFHQYYQRLRFSDPSVDLLGSFLWTLEGFPSFQVRIPLLSHLNY